MLKELHVVIDEPRTLLEVKLRKAYYSITGRDVDLDGLRYWSNGIISGTRTFEETIDFIANPTNFPEIGQYWEQGNGNPIQNVIRRDLDGNVEPYEAAFNTQFDRANLGYQVTGDIISLPYNHAIYVQNKLASSNVNINPYGIVGFIGTMVLNPPDNSVQPKPTSVPSVLNDPNDNYTTVVNNYKTEIASKEGKVITSDSDSGFYGSYYGEWELLGQGTAELDPNDNKYKRVDTYVKYRVDFSIKPQYQTVTSSGQRRDIVYDQNVRPKMSDIRIGFSAAGLKPNTVLNAFFGDRNVTSMCTRHTFRPDGFPFVSDQLVTDYRGEIQGTFTYSEEELNFDAGAYLFCLSDSSRNDNDRNTYASALFNGWGLTGYSEETFRTRRGELSVNKTSTVAISDPRSVIVGEGPSVPPPVSNSPITMDMLDMVFVYGFGRRPTAAEKATIYDKWQSYGIHTMTPWNNIVMKNPSDGTTTNGNEFFREYAFLRLDGVLDYVDRAITVVPNGTDSADLRSKYLAAATYNYGFYDWYYVKDQPYFPATVNYMQFLNLDPTQSLTPPWSADLNYDCFDANGKLVYNGIYNSLMDIINGFGGFKTAEDYGGQAGWFARDHNYIYLDNNGKNQLGTPRLIQEYAWPRDTSFPSNAHVITTVWNSTITNSCMQPYRVVIAPATGGTTAASTTNIKICTSNDDFESAQNIFSVNKSTGVLAATSGGAGGIGPGWNKPKNEYPINEFSGAATMWAPLGTSGTYTGNLIIPNTPYVLQCLHHGNQTTQIIFAINSGQTGNTSAVPIRISCSETGTFYDTWIPAVGGSGYWDNGVDNANYVDVYNQYGADPLGIAPLLTQYKCMNLQLSVRDPNEVVTAPPVNGGYGGGSTGGAGAGADNNLVTTREL